jgi:predicted nucleotidyltransferase
VLATFPEVEKVVVYGSRAKGNFKPGSDIDLTFSETD